MSPPRPAPNPYDELPHHAFWRSAVAEPGHNGMSGLWTPKVAIAPKDPVACFGSCFAQHIGQALQRQGFNWLVTEKPPRATPAQLRRAYGYGLFSARTGNIYTPSLLLQWLEWAFEIRDPPAEVWACGPRLRDPFRPQIEPSGFASVEELERLRALTLRALRKCVTGARVFVFTLGLTERWINSQTGHEYPLCPGTAAGRFDPDLHQFAPLDLDNTLSAMRAALDLMARANPDLRFLLTVSPVPLTATARPGHVLTASSGAKSVLRAVAGHLAETRTDTDYFPSYELITSPVFGGRFYDASQRRVTADGVRFVMDHFFRDLGAPSDPARTHGRSQRSAGPQGAEDLVCDEEILAAFGPRS